MLKILSHTQRETEVQNFVGFSLRPHCSKVMALFAYHESLRGYCSDITRTFSTSKHLKKASNRLNTTWNTTQCKAALASFFLFRTLPVTHN